jgi:hypothetical protein
MSCGRQAGHRSRSGGANAALARSGSIGHTNTIRPVTSAPPPMDASFEVSDGKLSCAGSYSLGNPSATITTPVLCNDGRKGLVTATREYGGISGGGRFTLNDGTTGDFIFGAAASKL